MKNIHGVLIVGILLLSAGCIFLYTKKETIKQAHTDYSEQPVTQTAPDVADEEPSPVPGELLYAPFDLRREGDDIILVAIDGAAQITIVPHLLATMRNTQRLPDDFEGYSLADPYAQITEASIVSSFYDHRYLIVQGAPGDIDGLAPRPLWRIDTVEKTMTFLEHVNSVGPRVYLERTNFSPNGKRLIEGAACTSVRVYDMEHDTAAVKQLPLGVNQTVCRNRSLTPYDPFVWLDDTTAEYSVFDARNADALHQDGIQLPFLFTQTIQL